MQSLLDLLVNPIAMGNVILACFGGWVPDKIIKYSKKNIR